MNSGVNAYDVARVAGVSRTVVSYVMNGKADKYRIPAKTQERVRTAIARMGYTPNRAIRNMFLNRRPGIDLDAVRRMDTAQLIAILEPVLAEKGYRLAPCLHM